MIEFIVHGEPAPQGSKNQWGAEANPRTKPWRANVSASAAAQMHIRQQTLFTEAVQVKVEFVFTRPKSHYGTGRNAGTLKQHAPEYVSRAPDVDKLARAILDAMTGIVFRDDAQVAHLNVWKRYGDSAMATVQVQELVHSALEAVA